MKAIKRIIQKSLAGVLVAALAVGFTACTEQTPFEADINQSATLAKRPATRASDRLISGPEFGNPAGSTVETGSTISWYNKKRTPIRVVRLFYLKVRDSSSYMVP